MARYQMAAALFRLGEHREALQEARRMHQSGLDLGDEQMAGHQPRSMGLYHRQPTAGRRRPGCPGMRAQGRPRHDAGPAGRWRAADGPGPVRTGGGPLRGGLERRPPRGNDERLRGAEPGLAGRPRALPGREAAGLCGRTAPQALEPGREGRARRALRTARWLQNDRPHALREYGRILALQGKTRRALRCFAKSLAVAQRQGAKYEHAQTLLADGQLRQLLGHPGAEQQVADALAALSAIAIAAEETESDGREVQQPTLSLADRFQTVLEDGRKIASALSPAMIYRGGPRRGPAVTARRTLPGAGDRSQRRPGMFRAGGG